MKPTHSTNIFVVLALVLGLSCPAAIAKRRDYSKPDLRVQTKKNWWDNRVDKVITKHLGSFYRRATIFDIYPDPKIRNKKKPSKKEREILEYLTYVRRDLRKISQSDFLKFLRYNFDGDYEHDYAVVVTSTKNGKNALLIANDEKVLSFQNFNETHLEPINDGKFPVTIATSTGTKKIFSPAFKVISFEKDSKVVYFDRKIKEWKMSLLPY